MYRRTAVVSLLIVSALSVQDDDDRKGHWGPWAPWSVCSVTCGQGIKSRVAKWILGPNDPKSAKNFTMESVFTCPDGPYRDCPTDGLWSGWYSAGRCSKMCGGGERQRKRICTGMSNGGKPCEGEDEQHVDCNREPCPRLPPNFDLSTCRADTMFNCSSNLMCVSIDQHCDREVHCHDGSDEENCPLRVSYRGSRNAASPSFNSHWIITAIVSRFMTAMLFR